MLSEIEITYFRCRIDDGLREGQPTAWQRQFLADMRGIIDRYGTKDPALRKTTGDADAADEAQGNGRWECHSYAVVSTQ